MQMHTANAEIKGGELEVPRLTAWPDVLPRDCMRLPVQRRRRQLPQPPEQTCFSAQFQLPQSFLLSLQDRMHLDCVFSIIGDDCCIMMDEMMGEESPTRRLVDEWVQVRALWISEST